MKAYAVKTSALLSVYQNGMHLGALRQELRTPTICKLAVQRSPEALKFVPEEQKTKELCEIAVKGDAKAVKFVPEDKISMTMCLAINEDDKAFEFLPSRFKDGMGRLLEEAQLKRVCAC